MFKINASVAHNCAVFHDDADDQILIVDSFDNVEFNARVGNIERSVEIGSVVASSDADLTEKLSALVTAHRLRESTVKA